MTSYSSAPCLWKDHKSGQRCWNPVGEFRSYCKEHQEPGWQNAFMRERPSEKFIRNRGIVISRARGRCEAILVNGERCDNLGVDVDHIQAVSDGGTDDLFNLRYLCKPCHTKKTQEEANRHRNDRFKSKPRRQN